MAYGAMCGIVGYLAQRGTTAHGVFRRAAALQALHHRGPDDSDEWCDQEHGIWLGHRRLSVIDPGPAGAQPMVSRCGRYVLSYNGEIYNFRDLREQLANADTLRGHSDTEVLLETIAQLGLPAALPRLNGMFAFALWDRAQAQLTLARDRMGEKPLYYAVVAGALVFASELKSLLALTARKPDINPAVIAEYLRFNYVPDDCVIYAGFHKLPAATSLQINSDALPQLAAPQRYWSLDALISAQTDSSAPVAPQTTFDKLHDTLREAVQRRMIADVPLGAFLSGGIDSSLIVALMQANSVQPVRTFTIAFEAPEYDESAAAAAIARHLGTDHTSYRLDAAETLAVVPQLATMFDEPFADSSQIPTHLVAAIARRDVVTALSGDGGDELFAGYIRHTSGLSLWRSIRRLPAPVRSALAATLRGLSPPQWDAVFGWLRPLLPARFAYRAPGDKLHKLARVCSAATAADMYQRLLSVCHEPQHYLQSAHDHVTPLPAVPAALAGDDTGAMMYLDAMHYLPGDILTKLDRAAMAASLETRSPFLDLNVIEAAWNLPASMRMDARGGKRALRELLARYVPDSLYERPKTGFGVPIDSWLRGPLREWAGDLLNQDRIRRGGLLNPLAVSALWQEHLSGRYNRQHELWALLMLEAWRTHWVDDFAHAIGESA